LKKQIGTFTLGFLQVMLVSAQIWQVSHENVTEIFLLGIALNLVWAWNVSRIAFAGWIDRFVYAVGAALGSVIGLYVSKLLSDYMPS
jgi:hypothetical protein